MNMKPNISLCFVLLVTWLGATACGPIEYVNRVTQRASDSLEVADRQNAKDKSPYWWTRANLYLHKAREEAAHSGFGAANRYGRISAEASDHAAEQAAATKPDDVDTNVKPAASTGGSQ
jgi:hypothetical protein